MMNRQQRRRAKKARSSKWFQLPTADIPNMTDALLIGHPGGWVEINANAKGRQCVQQVFPQAFIEWRDPGPGFPPDWLGFSLNVPAVAALPAPNNLPPINRGVPLDEATPESLAFLMAIATKKQGTRAATWADNKIDVYVPDNEN